jgi:hypothetical protein
VLEDNSRMSRTTSISDSNLIEWMMLTRSRAEQHSELPKDIRREIKTCYQSDFNFIEWMLTRGRAAVI